MSLSPKKDILWRAYLVFAFICLFGAAVVWKIWYLQFRQGDYWRAQADSLTTAYQPIEATRGNIYSIDDNLLATSVPRYDLHIDFEAEGFTNREYAAHVTRLAAQLAGLFRDKAADEFKHLLLKGHRQKHRYFLLRRNVSYQELQQVRTFPIFREGRFKGGLIATQKSKRELPFRKLAARTIGQSRKNAPNVGIEGYFDEYLQGRGGVRLMQKISGGVWKPLNADNEIEPKNGLDVVTTLDVRLQDVAEHSLEERLKKHNADAGCAILMEVATGEVRAIANLKRGTDGFYREEYNMAVGQSTEPGSTFKLISLLAAIEDGRVDVGDSVHTGNGMVYWTSRRPLKDSHHGGYGKISVQHAFEVSSNVGISKVIHAAYSRNPQDFVDRIRSMHVGEKLGLQIKGEGNPVIKGTKNKSWSGTTLPYMSIGYECALTPLQLLCFYNAIANNGVLVKPIFVTAIADKGHVVKRIRPQVVDSAICSPATIVAARQLLEGVVQHGTGRNLRHSQYAIAGKTGTARVANKREGYENLKYQASFVGYFPADQPKYSCMVVVYAPSNDVYYASDVAAPIFKDISDKVFATDFSLSGPAFAAQAKTKSGLPAAKAGQAKSTKRVYAGLAFDTAFIRDELSWISVGSKGNKLFSREINKGGQGVPDVSGMGLRDAVFLLENAGLQVTVTGKGAVVRQSLAPGTPVVRGQPIVIELS